MSDLSRHSADLLCQLPTRGDGVRPTNSFVQFKKEDIEQSIPSRFEQQVREHPDRLAVKTRRHELTYHALNKAANRVFEFYQRSSQSGQSSEMLGRCLDHPIHPIL